jgi:8-oxo-dGTP diphosphatase
LDNLGVGRYDLARVEPAASLECVAFLLVRDRCVLAEKRKLTKRLAPGALAIPGGHVEPGEELAQALRREAQEELAIVPGEAAFVCTLMVSEYLRLEREGGLEWRTTR